MRQFFAIILLMIYSVANVGATVQYHYCGGELVSIKPVSTPEGCCATIDDGCIDIGEEHGCCDDEYEYIKTDLATKSFLNFNLSLHTFVSNITYGKFYELFLTENVKIATVTQLPKPPPVIGIPTPLFILFNNQKIDC